MIVLATITLFGVGFQAEAAAKWKFSSANGKKKAAVNGAMTLERGDYLDMNIYKDGKQMKENHADYSVKWYSSNPDVVYVDKKTGKMKADKYGKVESDAATAKITAVVKNKKTGGTAKKSFKITVVPKPSKPYTYTFSELKCMDVAGCTYEVTDAGTLDVKYDNQYARILLYLENYIDLEYCEKIVVRVKSEYESVAIQFYDDRVFENVWCQESMIYYGERKDGIAEYVFEPDRDAEISVLGIMSLENPDDFSKYLASAYDITFYMEDGHEPKKDPRFAKKVLTKKGDTTYDFQDMKVVLNPDVDYAVQADGSIALQHKTNWAMIKLALPKAVDMSKCVAITVESDSENPFAVAFFDAASLYVPYSKDLFTKFDCNKKTAYKYNIHPGSTELVYGIGIMGMPEESLPEGALYDVSVESITFHMVDDDVTVPVDIAPDVTEDMTLRNTYGTKLDYIGTGVTSEELRHPELLRRIKEQCNSVTLAYESKFDWLLTEDRDFISVAEAKKRGYFIPDNYKDEKVPVFSFDNLDEVLTICAENGLGFRFHTLVWHESTRTWFFRDGYSDEGALVRPEVMDARLEFYIRNVMEHVYSYKDGHVVYAWDVVNEYYHSYADNSDWYRVYGDQGITPEYVKLAFQVADEVLRKYGIRDEVSLFVNEYSAYEVILPFDMPKILLELVAFVNMDGKICDGIGMQGHINSSYPNVRMFMNAVNRFLDAGLEVQITEMDVQVRAESGTGAEDQVTLFSGIFCELAKLRSEGAKVTGITMWDRCDNDSGFRDRTPGLFSFPGRPKDVYFELLQAYTELQ